MSIFEGTFFEFILPFCLYKNIQQDISNSDEFERERLQISNPKLFDDIEKYFTTGPEVVLLPVLNWDYALRPDMNEEGAFRN